MAERAPELYSASSLQEQRRQDLLARYGGFYWGADFLGFAVATFFTIVFLGIVGAIIGAVGYQLGAPVPSVHTSSLNGVATTTQQLGLGGLIGALIAVFLAYFLGGYAAGRMTRFDGVRNGVGVVIWTIIVAIILGILGAIFGSKFNVGSVLHLNISASTLTTAGVISLIVTLVVMFLGAMLGGAVGGRFHRRYTELGEPVA